MAKQSKALAKMRSFRRLAMKASKAGNWRACEGYTKMADKWQHTHELDVADATRRADARKATAARVAARSTATV